MVVLLHVVLGKQFVPSRSPQPRFQISWFFYVCGTLNFHIHMPSSEIKQSLVSRHQRDHNSLGYSSRLISTKYQFRLPTSEDEDRWVEFKALTTQTRFQNESRKNLTSVRSPSVSFIARSSHAIDSNIHEPLRIGIRDTIRPSLSRWPTPHHRSCKP